MKLLAIAVAAFVLGGATAVAAVQPWKVAKVASATGDYATAQASATIKRPVALAVRSTAGPADVTWSYVCSGSAKVNRGEVYVLTETKAQDCVVSALGSAAGRVSVQVLRR